MQSFFGHFLVSEFFNSHRRFHSKPLPVGAMSVMAISRQSLQNRGISLNHEQGTDHGLALLKLVSSAVRPDRESAVEFRPSALDAARKAEVVTHRVLRNTPGSPGSHRRTFPLKSL